MSQSAEYDVTVRLDDADIKALGVKGLCRVGLIITATSGENARELASKYGYVGMVSRVDERSEIPAERKKQLIETSFYRPTTRNEEIYTYFLCDRCKSYITHQQVWCSWCGSKMIARKGRASEFEKDGYEDGYSISWYKKGGFFAVSIKLQSLIEPLGLVPCRVTLGIKAQNRHDAVKIASKHGEVYFCDYCREGDKFFGIMLESLPNQ